MEETPRGILPEMTWQQVFRVWWLLAWRGIAGLILIGGAVGYVVGLGLNSIGASQETIKVMSTLVGISVYLLWGLVIVRTAINKQYSDFELKFTER
ncbi:MAG: hypothetical protein ACKVHL_04775 [Rhodospirillales bacterium]|jgi:hypothetical protein